MRALVVAGLKSPGSFLAASFAAPGPEIGASRVSPDGRVVVATVTREFCLQVGVMDAGGRAGHGRQRKG